jgi:hypothetical protein
MLLLGLMLLVTLHVQRQLSRAPGRVWGAVTLIGWVGILAAGRWIAYTQVL